MMKMMIWEIDVIPLNVKDFICTSLFILGFLYTLMFQNSVRVFL